MLVNILPTDSPPLPHNPIVGNPGFKNVKNKHLCMPPFQQNVHLFYPLVHSMGSKKPDIAFNSSLANIPVTVC